MKVVEVLFPELGGIYGDKMNMVYFEKCSKKIKMIETWHTKEPYFAKHKVDMIYIGPMTEDNQEKFVKLLMPYKKKIKEMIEDNVVFLVTGNALEMFGKYILDGKRKIKCLGIFDCYAKRDLSDVVNYLGLGKFNEHDVIIHKVQFSKSYGDFKYPFILKDSGLGMNDEYYNEGIHYKNFYGTYSLGPILLTNPHIAECLLKDLNIKGDIVFKNDIIEAFETRLERFKEVYDND